MSFEKFLHASIVPTQRIQMFQHKWDTELGRLCELVDLLYQSNRIQGKMLDQNQSFWLS